jgi:HlyD family secretion protein
MWRGYSRAFTVQVAPIREHVVEQVFGLGAIGADVQSALGFKVAGVISRIDANEGDVAKAGQVLAQLDARDVAAQLALAKAGVQQARAAIDKADADISNASANLANATAIATRREALSRKGFASAEESQNYITAERVAEGNLQVAKVEAETARAGLAEALAQEAFEVATLGNYTLRAPYDGWVVARNLNLGASVAPGQAVFTVVDPRTIWVVGYVDERLAGRLHVGQKAEIVLRSEAGRRFPGHVARIEIQSNATNEERLVDVAFDKLPSDIHLAEQAEIYVTTGVLARAALVPQSVVTGLADGKGTVWTVQDGRLRQHQVSFGPELLDGDLPVVAGLAQNAKVVTGPAIGLRAGRAAKVAKGPAS